MSQATIVLNSDAARAKAARWVAGCSKGTRVTFKDAKRSLPQNDRMWALLTEVSEQVKWYGFKLSPDEWKTVFTAGMKRHRVVPGIDGHSFVAIGVGTSGLSKEEMSNLMLLIESFGAERGVVFSDPTEDARCAV